MKVLYLTFGLTVFYFTLLTANAQLKYKQVKIKLDDRVSVIAEVADTPEKQILGLSFKKSLQPNHGMLFIHNHPTTQIIWMRNMRFAIDILWIKNQHIVHIEANAPPPKNESAPLTTYGHGVLADMVLEVPAGFSQKNQIQIGQTARISH